MTTSISTEEELQDFFEEAISDSIDMDWQPRWGARQIMAEIRKAALSAPAEESSGQALSDAIDEAWQDLLDKDDRTSPAEYPEMALISHDELASYMAFALSAAPAEAPAMDWRIQPPEIPSVSRVISYLRDFGPGTTDTTDRYMMRWAADHLANLESRALHWQRVAEAPAEARSEQPEEAFYAGWEACDRKWEGPSAARTDGRAMSTNRLRETLREWSRRLPNGPDAGALETLSTRLHDDDLAILSALLDGRHSSTGEPGCRTLRPPAPQGTEMKDLIDRLDDWCNALDRQIEGDRANLLAEAAATLERVERERDENLAIAESWANAHDELGLKLEAAEAQVEALRKALEPLVEEFGASIEQYHKIGPDWTHKDGTETLNASTLLDREPLIEAAAAALAALSAPAEESSEQAEPLNFEAQRAERLADPEWLAKWNASEDERRPFEQMLHALRAEEGDSVALLSDNPDFNGQPNNAIECCGAWTGWQERRFTGDTLRAAVLAAYRARHSAS